MILATQTRKTVTPEELFSQKIYWLNQLSEELPETNFITDYVRPVFSSGRNKLITFDFPAELSEAIICLTKRSDFSIYLLLLSAISILLQKYTGTNDVILGSPVYQTGDFEGLINKVVPLRFNVMSQLTFKDLLLQVKDTTIGAYSHCHYLFDELVYSLKLPHSQNRCPIFDIAVLLENIHNLNDIESLNNDITVSFRVDEKSISGKINYNDFLFKKETIKQIVKQYVTVVQQVIENGYIKLSDIDFLEESEKQQILEDFNDNAKIYPVNQTIHHLFEKQVEQTPSKVASVFADTQLTYRELNEQANQLARLLIELGLKKGEFVAILKERDTNFLLAILAILKAGGVYVPIDSTYPSERIRYMLSDSEVKFLLTDSSFFSSLTDLIEERSQLRCAIGLDEQQNNGAIATPDRVELYNKHDFDKFPKENLGENQAGTAPAYMMYTSGSTGLPKGAMIRHGGAINHIYAQFDALGFTESFNFLQTAPASSDISVWQFLAPILTGGKTVIVETETVCNPQKLFKLIQEEKATLVEFVPVVLRGLLDYISHLSTHERLLPDLKWMMVTGESASVELVNQWLKLYPSIPVVNAYGPTEAADDITQFIVEKPLPENQRTVPIGKPLANLNLYILDSQMQLVPIGVPGEICVSGFGVGVGYWKNEEKTKLSFVPNPFPNMAKVLPGTNQDFIYKTGDLGRWLPDGTIEFLGRIDHQVKIRGFRIELGEIEALLNQHSNVRETVVMVREDSRGDKRLVAYIVPNQHSVLISDLRNFLKEKLPEYMMPSAFVLLEALPLTPSGKVDRRSLPAPDWLQRNQEQAYTAPHTPVEEVISGIWTQVLGVDQVGVDDNFFEVGGHSLSATQLISRLRTVFQIELPLRHIFEFPTVATLAKAIAQIQQSKDGLLYSPILPIPRDRNLPLSFAQERLWFLDQLQPNNPDYNILAAVRLVGSLNISALEQSFNKIVQRHEVLRTNFALVDGQPVQVIAPNLTLKIPLVDLQLLPETERNAEVLRLAQRETELPFNLAQEPLLRVTVLKLDVLEHVVLFAIHHIVCDGWSTGILTQELSALYEAFSTRKPSPLPELPIQYADFANWQRQWLQGDVLETQIAYWKQQLAGAPTTLDLKKIAGNSTLSIPQEEGKEQSFTLSTNLSAQLKTLSRQEGATLFMTLLAAFQTLLYRYTNQNDIVVGTDVANRNRSEIEPLIGFFVNLLVLRTNLSGNPSFRELLGKVREVTLGAYAHQDLPFAKLVEVLQPARTSSHTPLFQVLFVMQNAPIPALELSDLTLTPVDINTENAKFDWVVFIEETELGIVGYWKYNRAVFEQEAIARFFHHFETLLSSIVKNPDTRIDTLEMLSESEKQKHIAEQTQRQKASFNKFKAIKPKAISLPQKPLIKTSFIQPEQSLPLVIEPDSIEIDLADWASSHRELIETNLLKHGAILFRGFNINSAAEFENVANAIHPNLFSEYGDLPREGVSGKVYGSTPYPADKAILFHNESSHLHRWPLKIWFFCIQPAQQGGETPIIDCRKVYQRLNPKLREKFEQKQLMYVRNYIEGLDVSWQDFFHTTNKAEVENYCRQAEIEFEWLENNGLKTRKICPAVAQHPKTGELVFFNQIQLHHVSCLDSAVQKSLLSVFGEDKLPRNVYYGDGTRIEDSVMEEIESIYQEYQISFRWQKGDILMLDNMLTAHSRNPYVGSRKIVVALGELMANADI